MREEDTERRFGHGPSGVSEGLPGKYFSRPGDRSFWNVGEQAGRKCVVEARRGSEFSLQQLRGVGLTLHLPPLLFIALNAGHLSAVRMGIQRPPPTPEGLAAVEPYSSRNIVVHVSEWDALIHRAKCRSVCDAAIVQ